ncbi:MAG: glycosyltransferase family 4 protein [Acidimicrobiia bacterium]
MKVIVAHNTYRTRGGEDQVFEDEVRMLETNGHNVSTFVRRNTDFSGLDTIRVAAGTVWNRSASSELEELVRSERADVVHFHNWLPQLSQAAFYGAHAGGAAVVQTLHNYRYTCAPGVLYRDGAVCEECVGKSVGWPAVRHGCYRGSRAATVPVVTALGVHKAMRTVEKKLDAIIVLSRFAERKMIEAGLPEDRLYLKPNFVSPDPGPGRGDGGYCVYVGRLVDNKGIETLLTAWETSPSAPNLKIAGAGPLEDHVAEVAARRTNIEFLGRVDPSVVPALMGDAVCSIVPSVNYEGFPKTIVESFAVGTPVIASDIGSLTEIIRQGGTGYLVPPGDSSALAGAVSSPEHFASLRGMRTAAREAYTDHYTLDANYRRLIEIYDEAVQHRKSG